MRHAIIAVSLLLAFRAASSYAAEPFKKGETLTYEVKYKNVTIGRSVLEFRGEEMLRGRPVYRVNFLTNIPSFQDAETIYAGRNTFLPMEVDRTIKKKVGFNDEIKEIYDQSGHKVDISQKSKLRSRHFSIKRDSPINNAILLTYLYRTQTYFDKSERRKVTLPTVEFEVMYDGIETIETQLGEYKAYSFVSDPPKFKLWLSADEKRTPLKIENPSTLGYSLEIESIEYR